MNTIFVALGLLAPAVVHAQTGVSDDRVSLPEGPGSLEGIGENIGLNQNMGTMTYEVPIDVPRGHEGLTPSLSLSYSSGGGGSVVGMGWEMAVPFIERMTSRGLPRYGGEDTFVVNGSEELVPIPGSDPPTYRARFESGFVQYKWHDRGVGAEGYWTAEHPDGRVGYFGATAEGAAVDNARVSGARGTFRYHLTEMVDVFGHRTRYTYGKYDDTALLEHVGYVYDDASEPRYTVSFDYEERRDAGGADHLSDARAGFEVLLTWRLASVRVWVGRGQARELLRRYALAYEPYVDSGGFTRLRSVTTEGVGGAVYPAAQSFAYSKALGGVCDEGDGGCARPFMVDMGSLGVDVAAGNATLIDINGDALPDVIDTSLDGPHRFFVNVPSGEGSRFDTTPRESRVGNGGGHRLASPYVQTFDANGDGFSDLVNVQTGEVLLNRGQGDWERLDAMGDTNALPDFGADFDAEGEGGLRTIRFLDYDNDKKIDVVRGDGASTFIFRNGGSAGFAADEGVEPIGAGFAEDRVQMSDMNGDGLLDPVRISPNLISYRLNLGWGAWGPWVELPVPFDQPDQLDAAQLEDLNGDGLSDVVVVLGASVRYALSRNASRLAEVVTIESGDVEGSLPLRDESTTVLFADMNGNGSVDVVWIDNSGHVEYLELFPVRPNLLSRIENGLGAVTSVTYGTSIAHMARDLEAGQPWAHKLPHPMLVVDATDTWDTLNDVHEVSRYDYRDGYYDGIEKQFRGYARVEALLNGNDTQEAGRTVSAFDVGATDTYRKGLLLERARHSEARLIDRATTTYADCPLTGVPEPDFYIENGQFPVRYICKTAASTLKAEGAPASEHVTTRTEYDYDGYGNVIEERALGVTAVGSGGCGLCEGLSPDDFGAPCGAACGGDERLTRTEFVDPADTGGRWIISAPTRITTTARDGEKATETLMYYDGAPFEGLPHGSLSEGRVTREVRMVGDGSTVDSKRSRLDAHGNVVESLDPLGEPGGLDHRRSYRFDEDGLRIIEVDVHLTDAEGAPYRLRRSVQHDPLFDKPAESTAWMRVGAEGEVQSPRRSSYYGYDAFGRITYTVKPGGDTIAAPTEVYTYDLADPVSRVTVARRSAVGGPLDLETVRCVDGRGRTVQERTRLGEARYQVTGFKVFNTRGSVARLYQPYTDDSSACEVEPPVGALATTYHRDALYRVTEAHMPDADIYGVASIERTTYAPLATSTFDAEDSDPGSPHAGTPTTLRTDGLGRLTAIVRRLAGEPEVVTGVFYDAMGNLKGYTDAHGNTRTQAFDGLGRVTDVVDPNAGRTSFLYDAAGNIIEKRDGRGVVVRADFDGANRKVAEWDAADEDGTRVTFTYDAPRQCDPATCTNTEGLLAEASYPTVDGAVGFDGMGFDVRGRKVATVRDFGAFDLTTTFAFDNANRSTATTFPDARTVARRYDDASRLVAIDDVVTDVRYDDRGQLSARTYADASATTWTYDALRRVATMRTADASGGALQDFVYTYNRVGAPTQIVDDAPSSMLPTATFAYDAWYRLEAATLEADATSEVLTFGFDAIDNLVERASSLGEGASHVGSLRYGGEQPNAVSSAGGVDFGYDAAGYTTARGPDAMVWDHLGRLTRVERDGATVASFVYGFDHRRVAKLEGDRVVYYTGEGFEVRDGAAVTYVRDGKKRLARLTSDALGARVLPDLVEDGRITVADARVALEADSPVIGRLLAASARRVLLEVEPEVVFLHHDHLGSVTMATDGALVGRRSFDPWGQLRAQEGFVDHYGYTGQERDAATGLLHFEWRYLDTRIGRWMSVDPLFAIAERAKMTRHGEATTGYAYVGNGPVQHVDPTGLRRGSDDKKGKGRGEAGKRGSSKWSTTAQNGKGGGGRHSGGPSGRQGGGGSSSMPTVAPKPGMAHGATQVTPRLAGGGGGGEPPGGGGGTSTAEVKPDKSARLASANLGLAAGIVKTLLGIGAIVAAVPVAIGVGPAAMAAAGVWGVVGVATGAIGAVGGGVYGTILGVKGITDAHIERRAIEREP